MDISPDLTRHRLSPGRPTQHCCVNFTENGKSMATDPHMDSALGKEIGSV